MFNEVFRIARKLAGARYYKEAKMVVRDDGLISAMSDRGLFQMSTFTNVSGNVLDLVYTDNPELCVVTRANFPMLPPSKSDIYHVPLSCTVECCPIVVPASSEESNVVFCFKKAYYDDINGYLSSVDLLQNSAIDVNESVNTLYDNIYHTFAKFVPRATIRSYNKPKW